MNSIAAYLDPTRIDRSLWVVLAVYGLLLVVGTHLPGDAVPGPIMASDKVIHFGAYMVLGALVAICVTPRGGRLAITTAAILWTLVIGFGALDELSQPLFGRSCDLFDWLADAAGAAIGIGAYAIWTRLRS